MMIGWFTDNTPQRFAAYGWHVIENINGHDAEAIKQAIDEGSLVGVLPIIKVKNPVMERL